MKNTDQANNWLRSFLAHKHVWPMLDAYHDLLKHKHKFTSHSDCDCCDTDRVTLVTHPTYQWDDIMTIPISNHKEAHVHT